MPSIIISKLCWFKPDGHCVLSDLNLRFGPERTALVGRNGVGKSTLLKLMSGDLAPTSGQVRISGTIGILHQAIRPDPEQTIAELFGVADEIRVLQKAEAGTATVRELATTDWTLHERIRSALSATGLITDVDTKVAELSGGEWTRARISALVFRSPDFLILDEPTNNLDAEGRAAIGRLLSNWKSGAIVASHDRELLQHVDSVVELTTLGAKRYGGNWDFYDRQKIIELEALEHRVAHAEKAIVDIERRASVANERSIRHAAGGSRRGERGDLPRIALGKRRGDAQTSQGSTVRHILRLKDKSAEDLKSAREDLEITRELSIKLPPTGLPNNKHIISVENVTAGYRSKVVFRDFSLSVAGPERIAIAGNNGTGKTTLLRLLSGEIDPLSGRVSVSVTGAVLDQHVAFLDRQASILDNFKRINPNATDNDCRARLASFSFRGDASLAIVGELSGGQKLRAGLACIFGGAVPPSLLILDEPTNHLDFDAVRALEAALLAYDGSIIVASHDTAFLKNIRIRREIAIRC